MISVLLPFRNAAATLEESAGSVLADLASLGEPAELLLIDDGSADDGPRLARALAERAPRSIRLLTLRNAAAPGIAGALATGLGAARGTFIARMDADDLSLPGRFAAERALLEGDATLGAVATRIELFGPRAPGDGIARYAAWQNALVTAEDHRRAIFVEAPVCHPSTMLRRSALEAVGGWRSGPFAEDYDLWLRLSAAGFGIAKVPEVLFRWRIHGENVTWNDERMSFESLRRLRATHLATHLAARPFGVWGAGAAGRRLARELETHGRRATLFIDIDPKKIGRTARGAPILDVDPGLARLRAEGLYLVVAVAARGARDLVRARLAAAAFVELRDYVCAA